MKKRRYGLGKHSPAHKLTPTYAPAEDTDAPAREETAGGGYTPPDAAKAGAAVFGAKDGVESRRRVARKFLFGLPAIVVIIPALFYLEFGVVDAFAWSFTVFLVVLCLLIAVGLYYADMPEYHTPVKTGDGTLARLFARVGSFWLVACAFGPFFGWVVTSGVVPLTEESWHWRYVARLVLCMGLPVLTALPLAIYVRGKGWFIMTVILLGVTSLPVWSGVNTLLDLKEGPVVQSARGFYNAEKDSFRPAAEGRPYRITLLSHTGRSLKIVQDTPVVGSD